MEQTYWLPEGLRLVEPGTGVVVPLSTQPHGAGEEEAHQGLTEWKSGTPEFAPKGDWP